MMRRLMMLAALLALAVPATAQEAYSFDATANQVTKFVEQGRLQVNADACRNASLPDDCTQQELQAVEGHEEDTLFADSQAGRQDYIRSVLAAYFKRIVDERRRRDKAAQRAAWENGDTAKRDAMCVAADLPAGCVLY